MPDPKKDQNNQPQGNEEVVKAENVKPVVNDGPDLKKQLEETEKFLHQNEIILDQLKKKQADLVEYDEAQTELMDSRRREIEVYDYSKRETFKETFRKPLPQTILKYSNLKEKDRNQYTQDIDKAMAAEKEKHDSNVFMYDFNKLKVNSVQQYNELIQEVEDIRNEIKKDEKSLSEKQMAWYKNTTDNIAAGKADLKQYYYYDEYKKTYQDKQKAFESEYAENTATERWNEEYAEYQSLLARRMMIKNAIKKYGMDKESVETFRDLDKIKKSAKNDGKDYMMKHAIIGMKMVQASAENPIMKELGYDDPTKANNALDEYYELEEKINRFYPRMEKFGTTDQKNWIHNHNTTKVDKYFNPDGSLKAEYSEFKDLSKNYSPEKNTIEKRERIMQERNDARFNYYQSAQSLRIYQREAINKTIREENKRIEEHNKQQNKKAHLYGYFSSQSKCDEQFLKDVQSKADEATKTRRKMMVGSVITGFASQIMNSVAGMATKAGTIAAEGIVKGETAQMEKELKALQQEQEKQIEASVSAVKNKEADKEKAKELSQSNDGKKKDEAMFKIVDSNEHARKGLEAEDRALELQKKIEEKQEQLKKQRKVEDDKLREIENKIAGKQFEDNQKKLDQNQLNRQENDVTELATSLVEIQKKLNVVQVDDKKKDVLISDDVLSDLMHAKTEARQEDLSKEEKDILKKDADLKAQLKTMQGYSDKIRNLMTPDNLKKVDTVVSICEILYSAYSSASKFINGKSGEDEKKKEDKKEDEKRDEDKKEEEKKDDEKEEEDNFELNITETIKGLKEKAEKISNSMTGKGEKEDNGTIIGNITDLTLEAGQIVSIVSKKIEDMTEGMQVSLEEARAREEVEKEFLRDAKMKGGKSPVFSALDELEQQKNLHKRIMQKDLDTNKAAINEQESRVKGVKETRDQLLKDLQLFEKHQEEERKKQIEEELKKAEEEKKKKEEEEKKKQAELPDTEEIRAARKDYEDATKKEAEARENKAKAEEAVVVATGARDKLKKEFDIKKSQLDHYTQDYHNQMDEAKKLQDQDGKTQKQKQQDLINTKKEKADNAKSAIRKTAVKSFFVNIANTAADYSKGFVDQMSIGFAEAVVKGKVKQMEDELAEKEDQYRKKGETALAKDRSRLQYVKKAQNISNAGKKSGKLLNEMITDADIVSKDLQTLEQALQAPKEEKQKYDYKEALKQAARAQEDSQKLHKERADIKKEIEKMQEDLATERVKEQKKLDELHEELKKAYGIDPNAARKTEIDTAANKAKAMVALKQVEDKLKTTQDPIDIFTSPAYSETDAAQREVIKQQVKDLHLDKEVEEKGKRLEEISNKLKGLFTPKNMGRVDTVVSAAETLYSLYGSVKGFITGDGGGDDKEADEEEKNIAGKIHDIKEKATSVRKGMMGEGEVKEDDDPKIVENLLSITQSMREITAVVSGKIAKIAKDYEVELDAQREIRTTAEREQKKLQDMFKANANMTVPDAVNELNKSAQNSVHAAGESMKISQGAYENSLQEVEKAKEEYGKQVTELDKAEKDTKNKKTKLDDTIAEEIKRRKEQEEKERREREEKAKRDKEEKERKEKEEQEAQKRIADQEKAEREQKEKAAQEQRDRNDAKMSSLNDILDNLKDTGKGYFNHKNTKEYNAVLTQLQDFIDKKDKNIEFKPEQTKDLQDALTGYLDHTGMDTAWHESGNIRKENVLAALSLINEDKAKEYEMKANSVRRESKKINLETLMQREGVKRSPDRKRRAEAQKDEAQKVDNANERKSDAHRK